MKSVNFSEFRRNASELLDRVEQGETILILRHGKAVARLTGVEGGQPLPAWKRSGPRLVTPGASLSQAVLAERRSSR